MCVSVCYFVSVSITIIVKKIQNKSWALRDRSIRPGTVVMEHNLNNDYIWSLSLTFMPYMLKIHIRMSDDSRQE